VSCAYFRDAVGLGIQRPKVTLLGIEITKARLSGIDLAVTLKVQNPNHFDLDLSNLRYEFIAGGNVIASGQSAERTVVPELAQALVKLPLTVSSDTIAFLTESLFKEKASTKAVLKAKADVHSVFGVIDVESEHTYDLKKIIGL
jgi:LEA14-like dessication related protein